MKEVRYDKQVLRYLDELTDVLIDKGYFSFYDTSVQYIEDIVTYIWENIDATTQHRLAPSYFSIYGKNLLYITYKRNNRTTWYIFFETTAHFYLIRHITNNHVAAQYFESL